MNVDINAKKHYSKIQTEAVGYCYYVFSFCFFTSAFDIQKCIIWIMVAIPQQNRGCRLWWSRLRWAGWQKNALLLAGFLKNICFPLLFPLNFLNCHLQVVVIKGCNEGELNNLNRRRDKVETRHALSAQVI